MTTCSFCEKSVPPGNGNCPHCGAAISDGGAPVVGEGAQDTELRALVQQGRTIEAIKLFREQTGAGLKEAKDIIDAMLADPHLRVPARDASDIEAELLRLLTQGEKIAAIKRYREWTGAGLKDAKDAVEALAARQQIVARSPGCLSVVLFWLVVAVLLV